MFLCLSLQQHMRQQGVHVPEPTVYSQALCVWPWQRLQWWLRWVPGVWLVDRCPLIPDGANSSLSLLTLHLTARAVCLCRVSNMWTQRVSLRQRTLSHSELMGMWWRLWLPRPLGWSTKKPTLHWSRLGTPSIFLFLCKSLTYSTCTCVKSSHISLLFKAFEH